LFTKYAGRKKNKKIYKQLFFDFCNNFIEKHPVPDIKKNIKNMKNQDVVLEKFQIFCNVLS